MNNIKVRTKLVIVMVIALIALALCAVISNTSLSGLGNNALDIIENDMRSSYDEQIKAQVDNVISLCQSIYNRYEKGEYTLDEAEKLAADQIRDLRYGNNGYFWVDTYDGTNVVLLGNDTEGTNRMDAVDTNGFAYMQAIINAGKQEDGGFTDYVFPREGETEPSPKRAYSKAFEPFGWVLGTGNYTDDIDEDVLGVKNEFSSYESNSRMAIIGIAVVMEVILILVLTLIIASIVKPLKKSLTHINEMAQGDFSKEFEQDLLKRKDDFGQLADSLEKMRSEMKELIGEVKSEALEITGMVQEIDTSLQALDDQIENVSSFYNGEVGIHEFFAHEIVNRTHEEEIDQDVQDNEKRFNLESLKESEREQLREYGESILATYKDLAEPEQYYPDREMVMNSLDELLKNAQAQQIDHEVTKSIEEELFR